MKQLGDAVGLAESTISQYENDNRHPNYRALLQLGEYLSVSAGYLLGVDDELTPANESDEITGYIKLLKSRPECQTLLNLSQNATKEEVEKVTQIFEILLSK